MTLISKHGLLSFHSTQAWRQEDPSFGAHGKGNTHMKGESRHLHLPSLILLASGGGSGTLKLPHVACGVFRSWDQELDVGGQEAQERPGCTAPGCTVMRPALTNSQDSSLQIGSFPP